MYSKNNQPTKTYTPITILLLYLVLCIGFEGYSQGNNTTVLDETVIGYTSYDLQTNRSVCRRVATNEAGDITFAAWTIGLDFTDVAPNRGTGFNSYNGNNSKWQTIPNSRIETATRTGWPTVGFSQNRQFSVTHSGSTGLQFTYRDGFEDSWKTIDVGSQVNDINGVWPRATSEDGKIYCVIGRQGTGFNVQNFGGINGGVNFIRSLDNGNTWESMGALEENYTNSFNDNFYIDTDNYAIDVKNGKIAVVLGGGISQLYLYTSSNAGVSWSKSVVQSNSNPLQENIGTAQNSDYSIDPFFGNSGSTIIVDKTGLTHIVFSGTVNYDDDDYSDDAFYIKRDANALFYWNETMSSPKIIGNTVMNDANNDGLLGDAFEELNANNYDPFFPHYNNAFVAHPQLGIDENDNLYLSYTGHIDGDYVPEMVSYNTINPNTKDTILIDQAFDSRSKLFTDVFIIKSTDGGINWQGPLNVTKTSNLEEAYPSIQRNIKDTIRMIYQRDHLPGTLLQGPQLLATINEIVALKILPDDINNSVAPEDSEPYISIIDTNIYVPVNCNKVENYIDNFYAFDYPEGFLYDFQLTGEPDFSVIGNYTQHLFVQDSVGNYSDSVELNINVIEDLISPEIKINSECEEIFAIVNSNFELPKPEIIDYYYQEGNQFFENKCDIELTIDTNFDISTLGAYTVSYKATDLSGNTTTTTITVQVVESDLEGPIISVEIPGTIEFGTEPNIDDWEVTALDNFNCEPVEVTFQGIENIDANQLGTYEITATATDTNGNTTTEVFSIDVVDTTPPVVTIIGDYTTEVTSLSQCGTSGFWDETVDLGVTAIDNVDGDISDQVTVLFEHGEGIPCNENRKYFVVYIVNDSSGNSTLIDRVINVDIPQVLPNDKCEDALILNPVQISDCSTNEIEFVDFVDNAGDLIPSCVEYENYEFFDVFYEVTVPESGSLYLKIDDSSYVYAAIYDACNGNELLCGQIRDDNNDSNLWIENLPVGDTVILQLFTQYNDDFSFCLIDPLSSVNNECDGALPLNVNPGGECESTSVTINFKFENYTKISSCNLSVAKNVFYKFIAPATGKVRIKRLSNSLGVAIYDSSCNGEEIYCNEYIEDSTIDNLISGNEYILELFSNSLSDVDFCIEDGAPTENNICSNAVPVTVLNENECSNENFIEVDIANNDFDSTPSCEFSIDRDLFYSFEVPSTGQVQINMSTSSIGCAIYDSCNGTSLFCDAYDVDDKIVGGLPAGETVIIQFFEDRTNSIGNFGFCISKSVPTQNDICSNAIPYILQEENDCLNNNFTTVDISKNGVNIYPNCDTGIYRDLFYSFQVPSTGQVEIDISTWRIGCAIYDGCNGNSLFCAIDDVQGLIAKNLPAGETVIVQFFEDRSSSTGSFNFCISKSTPPVNDLCENAQILNIKPNGACIDYDVAINFEEANFTQKPSCTSEQFEDVFFKTTTPANGIINVKTSDNSAKLTIYDACFGTELLCDKTIIGDVNVIKNLPPNIEVVLQFSRFFDKNLSICIEQEEQSVNNNCDSPTFINVSEPGNCSSLEVNNIANDPSVNPACESFIEADVFYEFVVPASGQVKFNGTGFGASIYDDCKNLSYFCNTNAGGTIAYNLPSGDTLLLQLFQKTYLSNIEFCLEDAPVDATNMCDMALPLTTSVANSCQNVTYLAINIANNTPSINPLCAANIKADAFYTLTVPSSGQIELFKEYTDPYTGLAIYDDCYGKTIFCDSDIETFGQLIRGLPAGEMVIFQFFQTADTPENFEICLSEAPLLVNDNCIDAIPVIVNEQGSCEFTATTNLKFSTNDLTTSCNGNDTRGVFFKATVPQSGIIKINTIYYDFYYSVYDGCSGDNLICYNSISNFGDFDLMKGLTPGTEIIIEIEGNYKNELQFCLEEVFPSENDLCENAIPLNVVEASACIPLPVDIDNRFNSADAISNCERNISDSYYSITVPQSGKLNIVTSINDINIALFESCKGSSIFCGSVDSRNNLLVENLAPGEQLILQIFQSSYLSEFAICVADPVINNACENATLLCNETTYGTNVTSGSDSNNSDLSCDSYDYYDVWYEILPFSTTTIEISATSCINTFAGLNVGILKGSCNETLEEVECTSIYDINEPITLSIDEVEANQSYYLYISSDDYDYNDVCNFEIKVMEGLELNCCQFEVETIPWCFPNNTTNGYYVDVIASDFGLSPGGYVVNNSSRINITEIGTTTLGPFPNGTNTLTFTGIDDASCIYTETFNFDCTNCAPEINHNNVNISRSQTFKSAGVIESNAKVTSPALNYYAQDSVILKTGFSVDTLTDFTIDIIENCD